MSRFVMAGELERGGFDWGTIDWRCTPGITGSKQVVVLDVALEPGFGHDFHLHPDQEEMIIVLAGTIEQWIEKDNRVLGPRDSVFIDKGVVHASFNIGSETARLQVVLSPAVGDAGYELVDVAAEEPWSTLRG